MSSEQDKDLVAKKMLAHTSAPLATRKMPFGHLLIPESVE